jgi:hypothetical protein
MNANETALVHGGQTEGFWTIQIREVPRFENPPVGMGHELLHSGQSCGDRPHRPIPMHWLPPDGSGPQEY